MPQSSIPVSLSTRLAMVGASVSEVTPQKGCGCSWALKTEVSVGDPPVRYAPRHHAHQETNRPLRMHSHQDGSSSCGESVKHKVTSCTPGSKHLHVGCYTKSKLTIAPVKMLFFLVRKTIILHSWVLLQKCPLENASHSYLSHFAIQCSNLVHLHFGEIV